MSRILSFFLLFFFFIMACNEPSKDATKKETLIPSETPGPVVLADAYLPSITMEELTVLWNTCNQIDYIFYDLPISSSIDNSPSAQAHIRHISDTPISTALREQCPRALGRVFYKSDGEDIINGEVYFSEKCAFYIFYKDGKQMYSNIMTNDGKKYYTQIVSAAIQPKSSNR